MNRKKFEVITNQPKICSVAHGRKIEMFELDRLLSTPDAREALADMESRPVGRLFCGTFISELFSTVLSNSLKH
jgi:hypothetical protein